MTSSFFGIKLPIQSLFSSIIPWMSQQLRVYFTNNYSENIIERIAQSDPSQKWLSNVIKQVASFAKRDEIWMTLRKLAISHDFPMIFA